MSAFELGTLMAIVTVFGLAQRFGDWKHKPVAAIVGYICAVAAVAWAFHYLPKPSALVATVIIFAITLWVNKGLFFSIGPAISAYRNRHKPIGPVLEFRGSKGWGNRLVLHPAPVQALWCVWVKNVQTKKQTFAHNVKAQIEYRDHDGADSQTVKDVLWIQDRFLNGKPQGSFESPSVDLSMEEDSCFIFALEGADHPIPYGALTERPNGTRSATGLGLGAWQARILVNADNCKPIKGEIDFEILPPEPGGTRYRFASITFRLPVKNPRW